MDYEEEVIKIIATEENLPAALEIADIIQEWKSKMQRLFWRNLKVDLNNRLSLTDYYGYWGVSYNNNDDLGKCDKESFSCRLRPDNIAGKQAYFRVEIQQRSQVNGYPFRYGVTRRCPDYKALEREVPEVAQLSRALSKQGFFDNGSWYLGLKDLGFVLMMSNILLRMANEPDTFIGEIANLVWDLFDKNIELIAAAHEALADKGTLN